MDVTILDLSEKDKWNNYIKEFAAEKQDIYFTPEYYKLYEDYGDGKAQCFVFERGGDIAIYPYLVNSVNDLGYDLNKQYYDIQGAYGYNGVLTSTNERKFIEMFYDSFNNHCLNENIIAEFTRFHPLLKNYLFSEGFTQVIRDRSTIYLDLSKSYEEIWENYYSSKNRNMIRKAQKKQFSIRIIKEPNLDEIDSFIKIYQATMRKNNAEEYYYFNEEYFINTFRKLNSEAILLEVVNTQNEVECTAIIFIFGFYAHYNLSGRVLHSDNSVNNFILDEAIKYSINRGAKYFHFGGGTTSNMDDPLLKFKSNFSKDQSDFYIGKKIHNNDVYRNTIAQWEKKSPDKIEKYKNFILKYRF